MFYKKNKRTEYKEEIEELYKEVITYDSAKALNKNYDRRGKLLADLKEKYNVLKDKVEDKHESQKDKVLDKINLLLDKGTKKDIKAALVEMKSLYTAPTQLLAIESFEKRVGDKISKIGLSALIADMDIFIDSNELN